MNRRQFLLALLGGIVAVMAAPAVALVSRFRGVSEADARKAKLRQEYFSSNNSGKRILSGDTRHQGHYRDSLDIRHPEHFRGPL